MLSFAAQLCGLYHSHFFFNESQAATQKLGLTPLNQIPHLPEPGIGMSSGVLGLSCGGRCGTVLQMLF